MTGDLKKRGQVAIGIYFCGPRKAKVVNNRSLLLKCFFWMSARLPEKGVSSPKDNPRAQKGIPNAIEQGPLGLRIEEIVCMFTRTFTRVNVKQYHLRFKFAIVWSRPRDEVDLTP